MAIFYGRGTQDIKDGDAILVTTLIRFKREGVCAGSRSDPRWHLRPMKKGIGKSNVELTGCCRTIVT